MSLQAMTWALSQKIPPAAKVVLLSIAACADKCGQNSFPGQKHIAEDAYMSDRNVRRWIIWLEDRGYISRERRERHNGTRTSDMYTCHMEGTYRTDCPVGKGKACGQFGYGLPDTGVQAINRQSNRQLIATSRRGSCGGVGDGAAVAAPRGRRPERGRISGLDLRRVVVDTDREGMEAWMGGGHVPRGVPDMASLMDEIPFG